MSGFTAYCRLRLCLAGAVRILAGGLRCRSAEHLAGRLGSMRSVYGPRLLVRPGDRTFELCLRGYGPFVAGAIAGQTSPFVFLDAGANLGLFSLVAVQNPHCRRTIAVEPLPAIFSSLLANIRCSGTTRIMALRGAIHDGKASRVTMSYDPSHSGMARVLPAGSAGIEVPVITVAMLDDALCLEGDRIVAKIDVEGSEGNVLVVLRRTKAYARLDELIVEVSEQNLGAAGRSRLLQMLADDGFEEIDRHGEPAHYDARYRRHQGSARQAAHAISLPG
jgi:FkbM family methyltransferase